MAIPSIPCYAARLCWNDRAWVEPAGVAKRAESQSHAGRNGYGHEEWLCNNAIEFKGWRYGFLEPINRSRQRLLKDGETEVHILLWTKDDQGVRWYVGEIVKCVILTEEMGAEAGKHFANNGIIRQMAAQIRAINCKPNEFTKSSMQAWMFNIRFLDEDLILYDPMRRVPRDHRIYNIGRYILVRDSDRVPHKEWRKRRGQTSAKKIKKHSRVAVGSSVVCSTHDRLQNTLLHELKRRGYRNVVMEQDWIDLQCRADEALHLFEVKADPRPLACVRDAVGQLLEYAYRAKAAEAKGVVIHVCGLGRADEKVMRYMKHLRGILRYRIYYHQIKDSMNLQNLMQDS